MQRLRTVSSLDVSAVAGHHAMSAALLFPLSIHTFPFSLLSPSLWETAQYRLEYSLKGPLRLKQPTNHMHESCLFYGSYTLIQVSSAVIIEFMKRWPWLRYCIGNVFAASTLRCFCLIVRILGIHYPAGTK